MRIDPARHPWMGAPQTMQVMAALEGRARFVGGAVRDAMLGMTVADIDIAVPMVPDRVLAQLKANAIRAIPTGLAHGTVTALVDGKLFEITSLRRDVSTDGRRASVAFTEDWALDAARRDFTINALYVAQDGEIFDYATGVEDLIAGRVCFMGDAAARIAEDHLRILRLFRFQAWYGRGPMDGEALGAAARAKDQLGTLSGERVAQELLRLLAAPNPLPVLRIMAATGILAALLPGRLRLERLEHLVAISAEVPRARDGLLRLAALLADDARVWDQVCARLRLSNAQRDRLVMALEGVRAMAAHLSAGAARGLLYRSGPARFHDQVLLKWADVASGAAAIQGRMLLAMADNWQQPHFALTGRDVLSAGVPQGPRVGEILAALEAWWIERDFAPNENALRDRLAVMAADGA
jgi:poly(A) polymerase